MNKQDWTVVIVIAIIAMYLGSKYQQPLFGLVSIVLALFIRHRGWDVLFKETDKERKRRREAYQSYKK